MDGDAGSKVTKSSKKRRSWSAQGEEDREDVRRQEWSAAVAIASARRGERERKAFLLLVFSRFAHNVAFAGGPPKAFPSSNSN